MQTLTTPPGRKGIALLGETLPFVSDGFRFINERVERHGLIFSTHLFGRETVIICGPEATGLFADDTKIKRRNAMPPHIATLFAGNVLPLLDGTEHRERKHFVLAAFDEPMLRGSVSSLSGAVRESLNQWSMHNRAYALLDDLKKLSLHCILSTVLSINNDAEINTLNDDYATLTQAMTRLPINLPGLPFWKAKRALERILARYQRCIDEHRARPFDDGLSRMLHARSPIDERPIGDDEAKRELHHIVVAGLIVWCWMARAIIETCTNVELKSTLSEEASRVCGRDALTLDHFSQMPTLDRAVMEVQRVTPILPQLFGIAANDFEFRGHLVRQNTAVMWAWQASHHLAEHYPHPNVFDVQRFAAPRLEHTRCPHVFAPQGTGDATRTHKCPGYQMAPLMLKVFWVELLRGYDITLNGSQDLGYRYSVLPPEPKDKLISSIKKRAAI